MKQQHRVESSLSVASSVPPRAPPHATANPRPASPGKPTPELLLLCPKLLVPLAPCLAPRQCILLLRTAPHTLLMCPRVRTLLCVLTTSA